MIPISIIIPAYIGSEDQVEWLHDCVQSAAVADAAEIIVVDDGSPIDISDVVNRNPNVRWYKFSENHGSSSARNTAVNLATNELIFPLDADDMILPACLQKLYDLWEGFPLYPDMYIYNHKTGEKKIHQLRDFDCGEILYHCGLSSVNVLHTKSQWKAIGGWREDIRYLEDAEYNSRLMYIYCGVHVSEPLILYRKHSYQKTVHMQKINQHVAHLNRVQGAIRRISGMGCCGGRPNKTMPVSRKVPMAGRNIPGMGIPGEVDDLVKVRYVGGEGKGSHYYRGVVTGHAYKVNYGAEIFVDPRDAAPINSLFEVLGKPKAPIQAEKITEVDALVREPKKAVRKFPVIEGTDLPDIMTINYKDVLAILNDMELTAEDLQKLYDIEDQGRNRSRVLGWLRRRM